MPRPDISPEKLEKYKQSYMDFKTENLQRLPQFLLTRIEERCIAGEWLADQLSDRGCSDELSERICESAGQIMFYGNAWGVVAQVLIDYDQGKHDEPGAELRDRLIEEHQS